MKTVRISPRPEGRRTGNVFIAASMLLSLCILTLIKSRYCSAPYLRQSGEIEAVPRQAEKLSTERMVLEDEDEDQSNVASSQSVPVDASKPLCQQTSKRSNVCDIRGDDIRIKASSRTAFLHPSLADKRWTNKPYARHHDAVAMKEVKEWTIKPFSDDAKPPTCTTTHTVPALVFSVGGFTGNLFHDFTDVIVPLFVTSYQFKGEVQFILSDVKLWWVTKFERIFKQLSNYDLIDGDNDGDEVRCFPRVILGLDFHKELGVNDSKTPGGYSMSHFKKMLRDAFGLERSIVSANPEWQTNKKPRLLIISRKKTRIVMNERGMTDMAMSLGFDVRIAEPEITSDIGKFARLVNSADVMIGVHGAGLTNMVFLPDDAVLVQIVPMGGLDWLVKDTFGEPSSDMKLKYMEYRIQIDESSLSEQYPKGHPVLADPYSIHKKGWYELSKIYLENQNVKPHLGRLRNTLLEALNSLTHNQKDDKDSRNSEVK